ncbi:MAG: DNA-3-methyladenine glycosylase family protein [Paracoccaceae bacterium]|nr:MAG: DNA-3-methyladenine glycosylase 2 family protein [Alphaproteobacteria bacterium]|tara:strand:+ start:230 stop:847 length:618 start_codon:yes stop_codon:yes gene_type:complete
MLSTKFIIDAAPRIYKLEKRFELIEKDFGFPSFDPREKGYIALKKTIIGQQLSIASAAAIWRRFIDADIRDEKILNGQADMQLRNLGLSRQKISYLKSLAGSRLDFDKMEVMENEEVIDVLTAIKGIGLWTAEIYCIFSLRRLDIFPAGDLALQEATKYLLDLKSRPLEKEMRKLAKSWVPYRSVCAIILWHFYRNLKSRESTLW